MINNKVILRNIRCNTSKIDNTVVINAHKSFTKRLNSIDENLGNIEYILKKRSQKKGKKQKINRSYLKKNEVTSSSRIIDPGNRRKVLLGLGCTGMCAICAIISGERQAKPTWGYQEKNGPASWKNIGVCMSNTSQSPINIIKHDAIHGERNNINFDFGEGDRGGTTVINTGHGTMQVNFESGMYSTEINGSILNLLQFHFHTPSEHSFDGTHAAMEAHLVHRDVETGELYVFGSLMDGTGQPNSALQACLEEAPLNEDESVSLNVDPNMLLPVASKRTFYTYSGSLTTPPCTENVNWYIFENYIQCSPRQVITFQRYLENGNSLSVNARPTQPLKNRKVIFGKI